MYENLMLPLSAKTPHNTCMRERDFVANNICYL